MLDVAGEADRFAPGGLVVGERITCGVGVRLLAFEMKKVPRHVRQCGPVEYVPDRADRPLRQGRPSTSRNCFFTVTLQAQALA